MTINETIDKLQSMRLHGMVRALREQVDLGTAAALSFEERLGLLTDREWFDRDERRVSRRLREAKLKQTACVEDIDYSHPRGLDKGVMLDLCSCRWIKVGRNVIITGATGLGKTWLACALANKACREGFTSTYRRVPRLLEELSVARVDGSYLNLLVQLSRTHLLILDDWGLAPLDGQAQHDILEIVDDRAGQRSTLITSQLPVSLWHDHIGDPSVADALLDRVLSTATRMDLKGDSLRKERRH